MNNIQRIAIAGGPKVGKSTLAAKLGTVLELPVFCTDAWKDLRWDEQPRIINANMGKLDRFILEGIQTARCLRGSRDGAVEGLDVDLVIICDNEPFAELTGRQLGLTKSIIGWLSDWGKNNLDKGEKAASVVYMSDGIDAAMEKMS